MRGYLLFSFWISIAPDMIYLSHIVIIWEKRLPISGHCPYSAFLLLVLQPTAMKLRLRANGRNNSQHRCANSVGVVARVLVAVCKRMQQLPKMLGPAVHRAKDTTHKSL